MFDNQDNFNELRNICSERTTPIIFWIGAGLSTSAGLPTWEQLKEMLLDKIEREIILIDDIGEQRRKKEIVRKVSKMSDYWESFSLLKKTLGDSTYSNYMKSIFRTAPSCEIPNNYSLISQLSFSGIITTNIDRLSTRAYNQYVGSPSPIEFDGRNCKDFMYSLQDVRPFILNLHGTHEDFSSWVFTTQELNVLTNNEYYGSFLNNCIVSNTIIFIGASVDDKSIVAHFEKMMRANSGFHFWITDRRDKETHDFCNKYSILPIYYDSSDNHKQLNFLIKSLGNFKGQDDKIDIPVLPEKALSKFRNFDKIDLNSLPLNELRKVLNRRAESIISSNSQESYVAYENFRKTHARFIHQAWFVEAITPENKLLDFELTSEINEGAFGRVFQANDKDGNVVALKLLKEDVMRKDDCLQSFRRGIKSMKILTDSQVEGMVPYISSSEIPAFVAMEFIDGITLKEAVEQRQLSDWGQKLKVLIKIADILKHSHHLPERVLHRDLRPANVMLKGYDYSNPNWSVVVLDFDLAWYKGASEMSIDNSGNVNGFLAPEQVESHSKYSTRNALVDSYGMVMLIYYVMSGNVPSFSQSRNSDWLKILRSLVKKVKCPEWHSLPCRLCRMIDICTNDNQTKRYDMSQIWGELSLLYAAYLNPEKVISIEHISDELGIRCCESMAQRDAYHWDVDLVKGAITLPDTSLEVIANDKSQSVDIQFRWDKSIDFKINHAYSRNQSNISHAIADLSKQGFKCQNQNIKTDHAALSGSFPFKRVKANMTKITEILCEMVKSFSF